MGRSPTFALVAMVVVSAAVVSPARAQEIQLTGPLLISSAPWRPHYLPFGLRGDVRFSAATGASAASGHDISRAAGIGGAFRWRASPKLAWEIDGGLLRGVEDARELRVPISPRAVLVSANGSRPDWELFAALGPSFERVGGGVTRGTYLGGEIGIGVDRRVDPVFNRFIVELVLTERRSIEGNAGWTTAALLRIGIMTTFGIRQ
jgi:hypothetical protein